MPGRVTNLTSTEKLIQQIFDKRQSLEKVRNDIASGVRIPVASEDPGKSGTILNLQATVGRIDRHAERIAYAQGILEHQEATLNSADDIMVRAQEIATQGANESLSWQDRRLLADEVFQLRAQMVSLGNSTYQGRYIYGAAADGNAPFTAPTYTVPATTTDPAHDRYVYNADAEVGAAITRNVQITDDDSIKINTPGDEVFSASIGALERLGRSLAGYRTGLDVTTGLPDGTGTAYVQPTDYREQTHDIQTALDALDSARNNDIISERSSVGSRINRLERVSEILTSLRASTETSRSALQDTDTFDAAAIYSSLQTSLQALLASGAQINNLSLLNYI